MNKVQSRTYSTNTTPYSINKDNTFNPGKNIPSLDVQIGKMAGKEGLKTILGASVVEAVACPHPHHWVNPFHITGLLGLQGVAYKAHNYVSHNVVEPLYVAAGNSPETAHHLAHHATDVAGLALTAVTGATIAYFGSKKVNKSIEDVLEKGRSFTENNPEASLAEIKEHVFKNDKDSMFDKLKNLQNQVTKAYNELRHNL